MPCTPFAQLGQATGASLFESNVTWAQPSERTQGFPGQGRNSDARVLSPEIFCANVLCLQLTQKKLKMEYKALDQVLQTFNKETHEKEAITYRCSDMDRLVPSLMGVSKVGLKSWKLTQQYETPFTALISECIPYFMAEAPDLVP